MYAPLLLLYMRGSGIMEKKVLVVDDEKGMVEVLQQSLESYGYSSVSASDGEKGLETVISEEPDLIILDVMMPRIDGYTFVKKMRCNNSIRPIPIIVLTGRDRMKEVFEFEGVKDYMLKPFKVDELMAMVGKYIN